MSSATAYLLDTNGIIEAVRVGVWNALSGGLSLETVEECVAGCRRGDALSGGYVSVGPGDLARLDAVHPVSDEARARLLLATDASALDAGELDLYAHALGRPDPDWRICSPDHASVRVGVSLTWADRLVSLEELIDVVGARPRPPLRRHFSASWLSVQRVKALLDH
ncbi:MAG: hypothetical protein RH859_05515 [Longimicrobiales bacterium]